MSSPKVKSGLDRVADYSHLFKNRRLALMTNQTGITGELESGISIFQKDHWLTALIACEHGIFGQLQAGEEVDGSTDPRTGLPVFSVYRKDGKTLTGQALDSFDALVYDIQDVGARFYTYLYSLVNAMTRCAEHNKAVIVLDRVNPLGGLRVQGTIIQDAFASFVGGHRLPTRYGLTVGEFALYIKDLLKLDLELHIVPLSGWKRSMLLNETGLPWPPPSPNCPRLSTLLCYYGTCLMEGTNLSEGRGTTLPFELILAPWLDGHLLAEALNRLQLPGIGFTPAYAVPTFSKYANQPCQGLQMHVLDPARSDAVLAALSLIETVHTLWPEQFDYLPPRDGQWFFDKLLGTDDFRLGRMTAAQLLNEHRASLQGFKAQTKQYHLYD